MSVRILTGDCRDVLKTLPDESVHCVVTSPPYFGLRDYGVAGAIGLEASVSEHMRELADVFAETRRVLRPDGTLWVNYGDAYAGSWGAQSRYGPGAGLYKNSIDAHPKRTKTGAIRDPGLKPKDLMGLPWRLAFALQEAGWWLRADIIWAKPNPMPESIRDRPTKSHEYIFMLAKSERYFYDADAIAEPRSSTGSTFVNGWATSGEHTAAAWARDKGDRKTFRGGKYTNNEHAPRDVGVGHNARPSKAVPNETSVGNGEARSDLRNSRSVWTIATDPFPEAHFATFPPELAERCIKAGCPAGGLVLDPFGGAGTVGLVADRLQRNAILIELNPEYAAMAERRIHGDASLFAEVQR